MESEKDIGERVNKVLGHWLPFITVLSIVIGGWYYIDKKATEERYIDEALMVTSCMNRKISDLIIAGEGTADNYITRYRVEIYFQHLPSLLNNYEASPDFKRAILSSINNMASINKMFDQKDFAEPVVGATLGDVVASQLRKQVITDAVAESKFIRKNFEALGFSTEFCTPLIPK